MTFSNNPKELFMNPIDEIVFSNKRKFDRISTSAISNNHRFVKVFINTIFNKGAFDKILFFL